MLLIEPEYRLDARSTEEMTVEQFCMLRKTLESSKVIAEHEFNNSPKRGGRVFRFVQLLLLYMLMESRKSTYRGIVANLSADDCAHIGLPADKNGGYRRPSAATLNGFVNRELSVLVERIGDELSVTVLNGFDSAVVTIDSTPLEASRYNFDAEFSPYYNIRMDRAHIIMANGQPVHMIHSNGNAGDNPYAEPLITKFKKMKAGCLDVHVDGGYDSFLTFAYVYMVTGTVMRCNIASDAVPSGIDENEIARIYGKMWKLNGFDPHMKSNMDFMLRFLYKNGKEETVGKYLRDKSMKMNEKEGRTTVRFICETMHRSMKRWVDFSIMRIRKATKLIRLKCRFLCVQFLSVLFKSYLE